MPVSFFWGVLLVFSADRLSKLAVVKYLPLNVPQPLLPPFLFLTHIENRGAAFGILQQQRWLLLAAGLGVLAVLWHFRNGRKILKPQMRLLTFLKMTVPQKL